MASLFSLRNLAVAALLAMAFATSPPAAAKTGLVYVSPNPLGSNTFLIMGKTGTDQTAKKLGLTSKTFESTSPQIQEENVRAAIDEDPQVVVVLGFSFDDILLELAPRYPDIAFLIVDQCIWEGRPDNVHCAVFREYEASYLIGVEAAMLSKNNNVGVVSALDIPFLHRYTDGYAMGAKAVQAGIDTQVRWVGGDNPFGDPVRAKEQALSMKHAGADFIFAATAGGDPGVYEGAVEAGFNVFTVDTNRCAEAPGRIYDSTLKRVDQAIELAVEAIIANPGKPHIATYGLKEGGMSLIALQDDATVASSGCEIAKHPEVIAKVRALAEDIKSGKLVIPDPMQQ